MSDQALYRICWTASHARAVFVTEALEGDDAVFLATHSPITGFDLAGRDAAEFASASERSVLDTLSDPHRRHAFCVVQGEPGSGKSHLIRWLSVNWSRTGDVKLLLRRADGSLEGALRQLRNRLPAEFDELFEGLGQRQKASPQGRANIFLATLAATLEPGHFDDRVGDEVWCETYRPADVLNHPTVRATWKGPGRILELLEGAGGGRNSATASFDVYDVQELAEIVGRANPVVSGPARELVRRLEVEAAIIRGYRENEWLAAELAVEAVSEIRTTLAFVDALNKRRNDAIQNVLGVSAQGLKTLFRKVRQALQSRGQRLILLLEDITSWEGLDDSLIDVLVFNSEVRGDEQDADVCPLISVVGVTPAYYDKLAGNYRQRITHELVLGRPSGSLQDVASLREADDRRLFAARYLAAVRAGVPALEGWFRGLTEAPDVPPPNVCDSCYARKGCFETFGDESGVGLFPFNKGALERFFLALKENDDGQTWRTPRGILQAVLNPNLAQPELIEQGAFPSPLVETSALSRDRRSEMAVSNRLGQMIAVQVEDLQDRQRLRRAITYWGEPERSDTSTYEGRLAFAGLSEPITAVFRLPWLGDEAAAGQGPDGEVGSRYVRPGGPVETSGPQSETVSSQPAPFALVATPDEKVRVDPSSTTKPTRVASPPRLRRTRTQSERMRAELLTWMDGGSLENASNWNALLHEFVSPLDFRSSGIPRLLYTRVVTADRVKLLGSSSGGRDNLTIPPDAWVRDGFEAYLDLKLNANLAPADAAYDRRNLASMMRRLETATAAYLRRRVPPLADGTPWSPVSTAVQVLLARAWLRGATSPDAPVLDQMQTVLSDEAEATSDPAARCLPWQEWLNSTAKWHERLRVDLRSMVSLPLGEGAGGSGLTDSSEMAGAVDRMTRTGTMDEVPNIDGGLPENFRKLRELAEQWTARRIVIERTEYAQVRNRAAALSALLRTRSIEAHIQRLDTAISRTSTLLSGQAVDAVAAWNQSSARIGPRIEARTEAVEMLISAFDDEGGIPVRFSERLAWLAAAPVRELDDALSLAQQGEKLVLVLNDHASDCVREARGIGSLSALKSIGQALKAVSETGFEAESRDD